MGEYKSIIGLEIHTQLVTNSKAFSEEANSYGDYPNTNISPFTLALPGTLPRVNKELFKSAIKFGISLGSKINKEVRFDRKNYFYPDMPKGYQITQDKFPICEGGSIKIRMKSGESKLIDIKRVHMEEDAGKLDHINGSGDTLIDLNRCGTVY